MSKYEETLTTILFLFYQAIYKKIESAEEFGEELDLEDLRKILDKTKKDLSMAVKRQAKYSEKFGNDETPRV